MMIGPAPMIMIVAMSVRFGMRGPDLGGSGGTTPL